MVILGSGIAALSAVVLSVLIGLTSRENNLSGQFIVAAVILVIVVFVCLATLGFMSAYRQIRLERRRPRA